MAQNSSYFANFICIISYFSDYFYRKLRSELLINVVYHTKLIETTSLAINFLK